MRAGIAGAGLMGRFIAWQLSILGWSVTVFDSDVTGHNSAAYAAAGMLSPYSEYKTNDLFLTLGNQGISAWRTLLPMFKNQEWFQNRGSLVVAHLEDKNQLNDFVKNLKKKFNPSTLSTLTREELLEYEPELRCQEGVFLSEESVIDTRKFLQILTKELDCKNVTWHDKAEIVGVKPNYIVTKNYQYKFDWVFDCRGYSGGEHFSDLRAVRGELIYLLAPQVTIRRPVRLLHPRYHLYVVPRPDSVYIVGASEIEAEDRSPISVRACLELLSAAYSLHPGFAEARILETVTGLRPALENNLPRIVFKKGMFAINGLYRHGFLFAPILLKEIMNLLLNSTYQSAYPELICQKG